MRHFHHINLFTTLIPFFGTWGYVIILISSFLEGLPLIGYISPGGISAVLGGFLARIEVLNLWQVLIFAFLGALIGDLLSFIVGKFYGHKFLKNYGRFFFLKEKHIEKTSALLKEHTGKAIIIGRFSYLTRSLSAFLAGASDISFWAFFLYDLLAVFIWDIVHVLIGFIAGQGYDIVVRYVNYLTLAALVLILLIFIGYRFISRRQSAFKPYHLYVFLLNIFSIYIFAEALNDILSRGWLFHIDRMVNHFIPTIWNPFVIQFMIVISNLLTPLNVFLFSCIFIGYLIHKREWYYALLSFFALNLGVIVEYFLKIFIARPRPLHPILQVASFSFPSGHATLIAIFTLLLYHCLRRNIKTKAERAWFVVACIFLALLVGASRIYLSVHWLSDVISGYALGVFSVTFCILFLRAASYIWPRLLKMGEAIVYPMLETESKNNE